jgi:hypothetical protein
MTHRDTVERTVLSSDPATRFESDFGRREGALLRKHNLQDLATAAGGEYVLGVKDLGTHACYMIYGFLLPGEGDRLLKPGSGHEEILIAVDGPLTLGKESAEDTLEKGQAVHLRGEESFLISNPSDLPVTYIIAGGHSGNHH